MVVVMAARLLLLLQRRQRLLRIFQIARLQILADLLQRLCKRPIALSCG
jgi:hypothetical protein